MTRLALPPDGVLLETERLVLAVSPPAMAAAHARFVLDNRTHLEPWEPLHPPEYYTTTYWRLALERDRELVDNDQAIRVSLYPKGARPRATPSPESQVIGGARFSSIVRGAFHACFLGYQLDHRFEGRGLMHEALVAAVPFVMRTFSLHRVQANYQPTNERSGRLLRRLGFVVEGYARDYLFIAGAWRDHVLTSYTLGADPPEGAFLPTSARDLAVARERVARARKRS